MRLDRGDIRPLGLQALFEACVKSQRVTSVDLSGHDLTRPGLFGCVIKLLKTARRLRMLSIAHTCIGDQHLCQLQAAMSMHRLDALQALSLAGNGCAHATSGAPAIALRGRAPRFVPPACMLSIDAKSNTLVQVHR